MCWERVLEPVVGNLFGRGVQPCCTGILNRSCATEDSQSTDTGRLIGSLSQEIGDLTLSLAR